MEEYFYNKHKHLRAFYLMDDQPSPYCIIVIINSSSDDESRNVSDRHTISNVLIKIQAFSKHILIKLRAETLLIPVVD